MIEPVHRSRCGTESGFYLHRKHGEKQCRACNDHRRDYRRKTHPARIFTYECANCRKEFRSKRHGGKDRRFCSRKCKSKFDGKTVRKVRRGLAITLAKYGMTLEQWDEIVMNQEGRCAICFQAETRKGTSRLLVDHCHITNKFRGAICHKCNAALGMVRSNLVILARMRAYILASEPLLEQHTLRSDTWQIN